MSNAPRRSLVPIAAGTAFTLAGLLIGCQSETKVVRYHPFLANVAEAKSNAPVVGERFDGFADPSKVADDRIVIENPNGTTKLISRSARHVMSHLVTCIENGQDDLLFDQVISQETKQEMKDRGLDPRAYVVALEENYEDIMELFSRMPFGEQSPSVIVKQPGGKRRVLRVTGIAAKGLRFTEFWIVMEAGEWRLLHIR